MFTRNVNYLKRNIRQVLSRRQCSRGLQTKHNGVLVLSEEVTSALHHGSPIVALETTIVTHGMPHPHNINTACEVEKIVKQHGATPATIGILNGKIHVGLTKTQLEYLADPDTKAVKTSRRDLPFVLSQEFVWVNNLSGVPKGVMWPGKLININTKEATIYVKSDNAELTVKNGNVRTLKAEEIEDNRLKFKSILQGKKKMATLVEFEADIAWIKAEMEGIFKKQKIKENCNTSESDKDSDCNSDIEPFVTKINEHCETPESDKDSVFNSDIEPCVTKINEHCETPESDKDSDCNSDIEPCVTKINDHCETPESDKDSDCNSDIEPCVRKINEHCETPESDKDSDCYSDIEPCVRKINEHCETPESDKDSDCNSDIEPCVTKINEHCETPESDKDSDCNSDIEPCVTKINEHCETPESDKDSNFNSDIEPCVTKINEHCETPDSDKDSNCNSDIESCVTKINDHCETLESDKDSDSYSDIVTCVKYSKKIPVESDGESEYIPDSDSDDSHGTSAEINELPQFINFIDNEIKTKRNEEKGELSEQESQRKPVQRKVSEAEKVRDVEYKEIYIKKHVKSNEGKTGLKKDDRPYDTVHACLFCGNLYSHIQDHIEKKHHDKEEVKQIMKLRKKMASSDDKKSFKKEIKKLQDCIRYSGDHKHNLLVQEYKEGELLIQRKSKEEFNFGQYGPCPECLQWIKLESSVRIHQKNCPKTIGDPKRFGIRNLIWQAKQLLGTMNASGILCKEVLSKMRNDEIGKCAQEDHLICSLGEVWLSKSYGHVLRRGKDSSFHMRLAAKLLLECRKQLNEPDLDMDELLVLKNFDVIVEAALGLCGKNEHAELHHPSTAKKIGFDLARLVAMKYGNCLKNKDDDGKEEADGFLKLMKIHWSTKVTTRVNYLLRERHFDNRRQLPHPKDIEMVATKLSSMLAEHDYQDKTQYVRIAKTVLIRLMVYNRRRSGEIEELHMKTYLKRKTEVEDVEQSLLGELSTTEQYLIKSQELMWIRGKRGKRVPVLIPSDATKALEYVVDPDVRSLAGLKETNKHMFATKGDGVISASESLKDLGSELDLIHPDRLSSTGYRAYMATIAQCLGLKDHQIQWLCTHLGHTEDVHKTHYRFALDGIERIQLGKLLLLQDRNLLSKYKNTNLEDIEFEDIISNEQDKVGGSSEVVSHSEAGGGYENNGWELEPDSLDTIDMAGGACDIADVGPKDRKTGSVPKVTNHSLFKERAQLSTILKLKKGLNGGTTVSGTMVAAQMAGISVFVTGGIGGVHRGAETSLDISADLMELGRTPVAVISSGVKSILDIGLTLEYLETQGVCVAAYGPTRQFPAFFTRQSGHMAPYNVETATQAAGLIYCNRKVGLQTGTLIAVPIPEEFDTLGKEIDTVIQSVVMEAKEKNIKGKEVTPFILGRVNEQTKGKSLEANIALIKNNAAVGSQIAVALSSLERDTRVDKHGVSEGSSPARRSHKRGRPAAMTSGKRVVVVGGINADFNARMTATEFEVNGATYPGSVVQSFGGVGRNLADALTWLGVETKFISAIGNDSHRAAFEAYSRHMDLSGVARLAGESTATYCPVMTSSGELLFGIGDMAIHNSISPEYVSRFEEDILSASIVVVDCNISKETIEYVCTLCKTHSIPVFYEPTDVTKAAKAFMTSAYKGVTYTSPNLNELKTMVNFLKHSDSLDVSGTSDSMDCDTVLHECTSLVETVANYIPITMVTLGCHGVLLCRHGDRTQKLPQRGDEVKTSGGLVMEHFPVLPPGREPVKIVSVSGAGDCLVSGTISGILQGLDPGVCIRMGLRAAQLSLQTPEAVPAELSPRALSEVEIQTNP